ncbi:MAG TPA: cysteate synthase [Sandaracinaceae bacterium LLY-WYZ-13_1]|nr:cysteate synthase [Sandaracinaceae bacterium LLY-WYZ-13_1]
MPHPSRPPTSRLASPGPRAVDPAVAATCALAPPSHRLENAATGALVPSANTGFRLDDPAGPGLLRAVYDEADFVVEPAQPGLFRYRRWLPARRVLDGAPGPVVWRADALGARLGLRALWVAFTGWCPARGAFARTGTFKELAACAVLAAWPRGETRAMVVASAGSTARAMLYLASRHERPVVVVVPERALPALADVGSRGPRTRVVTLAEPATYGDAIAVAGALAARPGYFPEGGARNVARRDGLGTALLAAVEAIGHLPDHYVQAVGSGTGAIGARDAARRLTHAGIGGGPMRLHLVQNDAFCPIHRAWRARLAQPPRARPPADLHAAVLSNARPPWAVGGGVREALEATDGRTWIATADEARAAGALFRACEGVDLHPAAEVGLAGLIHAARAGAIAPDEAVLFHATGGGLRARNATHPRVPVIPDRRVRGPFTDPAALARRIDHRLESP